MYTFDTNPGHVSYQLWQQTGVPLRNRGHGQSFSGCSTGGTTVAFAMIHATRQFELLAGDPKVFPIGATWHSVGKISVLSSDHFAHDYIITVVGDTSILVGSGQVWDELVVSEAPMGTTMPSSTCASKRGFVFKSLLFDRGVTSAVGHPSMDDFHEKTNVLAVKGWFPVEGGTESTQLFRVVSWTVWSSCNASGGCEVGPLKMLASGLKIQCVTYNTIPLQVTLQCGCQAIPTYAVLISAEIRQWRQSLQMISASPRGSGLKRGFTIISIKTYRLHLGWESVQFVYATPKHICLSQTHTHTYNISISIYI